MIERGGGVGTKRWRWFSSRWYAVWYFCISVGFLLLAVHYYLAGGLLWLIALRLVIAGGFAYLGFLLLRLNGRL